MILYSLIDENGIETPLATLGITEEHQNLENTFQILDDNMQVDVDVIEKSFTAGADFPGIQRDKSKMLNFQYQLHYASNETFRRVANQIIRLFRNARKIRNITENISTDVLLESNSITYTEGSQYRVATCTVSFIQLTPFWESYEDIIISSSTSEDSTFNFVVGGYAPTPPVLTLVASKGTSKVLIKVQETNAGIAINDLQFGVGGLDTMIIDNREGSLTLNGLDRVNKIALGTGFFSLEPGQNTLTIDTNGSVSAEISYRERYYV